jgi:hypothetical protein
MQNLHSHVMKDILAQKKTCILLYFKLFQFRYYKKITYTVYYNINCYLFIKATIFTIL